MEMQEYQLIAIIKLGVALLGPFMADLHHLTQCFSVSINVSTIFIDRNVINKANKMSISL